MANLNLTQEKLAELRSEYKGRNIRGKYPRQKMLPEYRCIYPWVLPDETDPYYTFCTVCECRLSAKRSDLGKHEGSIKHTENATKKGLSHNDGMVDGSSLVLKDLESSDSAAEITVSDDDDDEDRKQEDNLDAGIYIKHEPVVDINETSSNALKFEEFNPNNQDCQDPRSQRPTDAVEVDDESDDDDDNDDYENESDDESLTAPPAKRIPSDSDSQSQHSTNIKYTASGTHAFQRFSIRKVATPLDGINSPKMPAVATAQAPCKITIKKITAPIAQALQATPMGTTITSVPAAINISKQQSLAMSMMPSSTAATCHPSTSLVATTAPVRDSFDLFFDSICATVKTLPPKLATEGKVRVMQLIGELEIRAITEHELSQSRLTGQQNSTVASTTK